MRRYLSDKNSTTEYNGNTDDLSVDSLANDLVKFGIQSEHTDNITPHKQLALYTRASSFERRKWKPKKNSGQTKQNSSSSVDCVARLDSGTHVSKHNDNPQCQDQAAGYVLPTSNFVE